LNIRISLQIIPIKKGLLSHYSDIPILFWTDPLIGLKRILKEKDMEISLYLATEIFPMRQIKLAQRYYWTTFLKRMMTSALIGNGALYDAFFSGSGRSIQL